jgi:hypothetical protein
VATADLRRSVSGVGSGDEELRLVGVREQGVAADGLVQAGSDGDAGADGRTRFRYGGVQGEAVEVDDHDGEEAVVAAVARADEGGEALVEAIAVEQPGDLVELAGAVATDVDEAQGNAARGGDEDGEHDDQQHAADRDDGISFRNTEAQHGQRHRPDRPRDDQHAGTVEQHGERRQRREGDRSE